MPTESLQRWSPTPWFLVSVPEEQALTLHRPHVYALIEESTQQSALTLLEAPSGFGKTTSLAQWVRGRPEPTAWLTLLPYHSEPERLLSAVMSSLLHIHPTNTLLNQHLAIAQDGEATFENTLDAIISALGTTPTVIVIDDAHESSREAMLAVVRPLVRHGSHAIRFVIAGTHHISDWFTTARAKKIAHVLPTHDLHFTPGEVAQLSSLTTPNSGEANAETVWEQTGGWPVAVQLLLHSAADGSDDPLPDYIESEVLNRLPDNLREFVLDATTSDRLNHELITHIIQSDQAVALLNDCMKRGLFLDTVRDAEGDIIYRWHSLFAATCRAFLERTDVLRYRRNHRRASEWLAQPSPWEAVIHACQAHDPEYAVRILEDNWLQMLTSGYGSILEASCHKLPEQWREYPSLLYIRACCRDIEGDFFGAQQLKARGDAQIALLEGEAADRASITATLASMLLVHDHSRLRSALGDVEEVLRHPSMSESQYVHGTFLAGWTLMRLRLDPRRALQLLSTAATSAERAGYTVIARRASANQAFALAFAGKYSIASSILKSLGHTQDSAQWDHFDGGVDDLTALYIHYWQGNFDQVIAYGRALDQRGGPGSSYSAFGRIYFACAAARLGDEELIEESITLLSRVSDDEMHGLPWPAYKWFSCAALHWASGNRQRAVQSLDELSGYHDIPTTFALAADLWLRLGYPEQALHSISKIKPHQFVSYTFVTASFTRAVIAAGRGDWSDAHAILEQCIEAASREQIMMPFLYVDDTARELLKRHATWGTDYEEFIASALARNNCQTESVSPLLSAREAEILEYLRTTLTAQEIAEQLHLSPATVRSHQSSIYRKLGVTSRREAVRMRAPHQGDSPG